VRITQKGYPNLGDTEVSPRNFTRAIHRPSACGLRPRVHRSDVTTFVPRDFRFRVPIDFMSRSVHSSTMRPRSLSIPDARGQGAVLRVTKHPEQKKVVLSHWRDGLCVASTPVDVNEIPGLISVLADAMGDALDRTSNAAPTTRRSPAFAWVRRWLRPKLAQITELRLARQSPGEKAS
jgi:hypothetical protein